MLGVIISSPIIDGIQSFDLSLPNQPEESCGESHLPDPCKLSSGKEEASRNELTVACGFVVRQEQTRDEVSDPRTQGERHEEGQGIEVRENRCCDRDQGRCQCEKHSRDTRQKFHVSLPPRKGRVVDEWTNEKKKGKKKVKIGGLCVGAVWEEELTVEGHPGQASRRLEDCLSEQNRGGRQGKSREGRGRPKEEGKEARRPTCPVVQGN